MNISGAGTMSVVLLVAAGTASAEVVLIGLERTGTGDPVALPAEPNITCENLATPELFCFAEANTADVRCFNYVANGVTECEGPTADGETHHVDFLHLYYCPASCSLAYVTNGIVGSDIYDGSAQNTYWRETFAAGGRLAEACAGFWVLSPDADKVKAFIQGRTEPIQCNVGGAHGAFGGGITCDDGCDS